MTTTNRFLRLFGFLRNLRRTSRSNNTVFLTEPGNPGLKITENPEEMAGNSLQALMYSKENEMLFI